MKPALTPLQKLRVSWQEYKREKERGNIIEMKIDKIILLFARKEEKKNTNFRQKKGNSEEKLRRQRRKKNEDN